MILLYMFTLSTVWRMDNRMTGMEIVGAVRSLFLKDNFDLHFDNSSDKGEKWQNMGFIIIWGDSKASRLTNKLDAGHERPSGYFFSFGPNK